MNAWVDGLKVLIMFYILSVYFIPREYLVFASDKLVIILWIATAIGLFLGFDMVVGLLLVIALIVSLVGLGNPRLAVQVRHATPVSVNPLPDHRYEAPQEADTDALEQADKLQIAHRAIEKYVVDDYLHKASSDGILPENYSKFPNALGVQYNIQGIEKDMVGYNIGSNPAYTSD
jgi:hypothetical protein